MGERAVLTMTASGMGELLDDPGSYWSNTLVTGRHMVIGLAISLLVALALGLGYLWVLFDPGRLAWHDRLSGTRLVVLEKTANF